MRLPFSWHGNVAGPTREVDISLSGDDTVAEDAVEVRVDGHVIRGVIEVNVEQDSGGYDDFVVRLTIMADDVIMRGDWDRYDPYGDYGS